MTWRTWIADVLRGWAGWLDPDPVIIPPIFLEADWAKIYREEMEGKGWLKPSSHDDVPDAMEMAFRGQRADAIIVDEDQGS